MKKSREEQKHTEDDRKQAERPIRIRTGVKAGAGSDYIHFQWTGSTQRS